MVYFYSIFIVIILSFCEFQNAMASDLLGSLGGGSPFSSLTNKDNTDDGNAEDAPPNPLSKITETLGSAKPDLASVKGAPQQDQEIPPPSPAEDIPEVEEKVEELKQKNPRPMEVKDVGGLKKKHKSDVFYISMELVRPPVAVYSKEAFEGWYEVQKPGRPTLPYNNGRAARDTNAPLRVILAPDHQYVVYIDKMNEVLKDEKAGAKSIPIVIVEDHSAIHDEGVFWAKIQSDGHAWLRDSHGKEQKPVTSFSALKDDPLLGALNKVIPEIVYARTQPHSRVYGFTEYPAAVRLESSTSNYLILHMASVLKKQILADDKRRKGVCNFDDKTMALPDLMPILSQPNTPIDQRMSNRLRVMINEAFSDGHFRSIKDFDNNIRLLREEKQQKFSEINFNDLTNIKKQILVISMVK